MMIIIYSTFPNKTSAGNLTKKLLKRKLIACANLFVIGSIYNWKGKIVNNKEVAVFFKTEKKLAGQVKNFLAKNHPYQIPCLMTLNIASVNVAYNQWLKSNLIK